MNDKTYVVNSKTLDNGIGPDYKLVDFIRQEAGLTGTKYMCRSGGCGCCCVKVKSRDSSGNLVTRAVNSVCLTKIMGNSLEGFYDEVNLNSEKSVCSASFPYFLAMAGTSPRSRVWGIGKRGIARCSRDSLSLEEPNVASVHREWL